LVFSLFCSLRTGDSTIQLEQEIAKRDEDIAKVILACLDAERGERRLEKKYSQVSKEFESLVKDLMSAFASLIILHDISERCENPAGAPPIQITVEEATAMLSNVSEMFNKTGGASFFKNLETYSFLGSLVKYGENVSRYAAAQFDHGDDESDDGGFNNSDGGDGDGQGTNGFTYGGLD